jgi:hypothetical protein
MALTVPKREWFQVMSAPFSTLCEEIAESASSASELAQRALPDAVLARYCWSIAPRRLADAEMPKLSVEAESRVFGDGKQTRFSVKSISSAAATF